MTTLPTDHTMFRYHHVSNALRMMHGTVAGLLTSERRRLDEDALDMSAQEVEEESRRYARKVADLDDLHPGLAWLLESPPMTDDESMKKRTTEGLKALRRQPHWSAHQLLCLAGPRRAARLRPRQLEDGTWVTEVPYGGGDDVAIESLTTPADPRLDVESALIICGLDWDSDD